MIPKENKHGIPGRFTHLYVPLLTPSRTEPNEVFFETKILPLVEVFGQIFCTRASYHLLSSWSFHDLNPTKSTQSLVFYLMGKVPR